jgi:uncharacterized protein
MDSKLADALWALRAHEPDLRRRGIIHASIFGSVARGQTGPESDIDVLVDLDPAHQMGVFEYARLELDLGTILGSSCDLVNRDTLDPFLRESILRETIDAF